MKIDNRTYLRLNYSTGIRVSIDGEYAERDTKKGVYRYPINRDESGRAFIKDLKHGKLYMDVLTLTCYRGLPPQDGKSYYPFHKDGDMSNSNLSNLEWEDETPEILELYQLIEKRAWYKNRKITANKKGQIKQRSHELPLLDYIYDSDLDWFYHHPKLWVCYEEKNCWGKTETHRLEADKVFEDLGLVNGDKSQFSSPVILHLNNDHFDYSSDNLEWCDIRDPRYQKFNKIRHDTVMKKDHDCNCRLDEKSWNVIYRGREPYQDWTDRPEKKHHRFY